MHLAKDSILVLAFWMAGFESLWEINKQASILVFSHGWKALHWLIMMEASQYSSLFQMGCMRSA
jgi:hypothetical protein